jgi:hypothetical protein
MWSKTGIPPVLGGSWGVDEGGGSVAVGDTGGTVDVIDGTVTVIPGVEVGVFVGLGVTVSGTGVAVAGVQLAIIRQMKNRAMMRFIVYFLVEMVLFQIDDQLRRVCA